MSLEPWKVLVAAFLVAVSGLAIASCLGDWLGAVISVAFGSLVVTYPFVTVRRIRNGMLESLEQSAKSTSDAK
jgi:uncharacterized membrane protein YjjB (DUF3815 family)